MSLQGAGTNDFANLEGDDGNYFDDLIINDKLYFNPTNYLLGYTSPLIESVYDTTTTNNYINISTPASSDGIRFGYGTDVITYNPYLTIDGEGLKCDTDKLVSYYNLGCVQGASSNIQTQIDNIVTGTGYWGGFWSTTTQTNPTANTINLVSYTNSDPSNNQVSYSNSSRINVANKATYLVNASFQLSKSSGSTEEAIYFFLRKNGTNVSATGYKEFVKSVPKILTASWIIDLSGNDYIEIAWWSSDIHAQLEFIPAGTGTPVYPSSPSALVSLNAVSRIAGGAGGSSNPALNYFSLSTAGGLTNVFCNSSLFTFGSSTTATNVYSLCRGNFRLNRSGADLFIDDGRIRSNSITRTNELRNLTCLGSVSLYDTTSTYRFVGAGINNLTGQVSLGTYGNDNITCFSNFIKRSNDQYAIYVKTGDLKLEAGTLYPNNIYWDASNNWNGVEIKTNNLTSIGTITANDITTSGAVNLNGSTNIGDALTDSVIINGKLGYMNTGSFRSLHAQGEIYTNFRITSDGRIASGTSPNQAILEWNNTYLNNLETRGNNYFYGNNFVVDKTTSIIDLKGNVFLGSSSSNLIGALGNFRNRGDGYSIFAVGEIRANGANLTTTNDIYCNCYSVGSTNYGYYKLWDFIREQDDYNYNRTTDAINKADDAYDLAAAAQATATSTAAALALQSVVVAGVIADVTALQVSTAANSASISTLATRTTALENKTANMLPATANASHFLENIQVYQTSDPFNPVIDLNPYGLTTIGGGVKTNQIRHTANNTKLDITYGVNTGDITCDEIGSNSITNSGNIQTGTLNTGSITATTGTHSIDGSSVSLGSYSTPVYINGLLYIPWLPTGFWSQW